MIPIKYRPKIKQDGEGRVERNYEEPAEGLIEPFSKYLDKLEHLKSFEENYELSKSLLEGNTFYSEGIEDLFTYYRDLKGDTRRERGTGFALGTFISAVYNLSRNDSAFFHPGIIDSLPDYLDESHFPLKNIGSLLVDESHFPLKNIGSLLEEDKTLVIDEEAEGAGYKSKGLVINRDSVDNLSPGSTGVTLNFGDCKGMGLWGGGILINFGDVKHDLASQPTSSNFEAKKPELIVNFGRVEGAIINPAIDSVVRESEHHNFLIKDYKLFSLTENNDNKFVEYMNELKETFSSDREALREFFQKLDPDPSTAIEKQIRKKAEVFD